ncbi:MAG TPA: histidine--tRNA ligase [Kiritimatiellia bacterium]|nr:histidine--tRNA ligase [Kiritimatiellia bacterium]
MGSDVFQPIQGMDDLAAPEIGLWQELESTSRRVFHLYGYSEVRTPVLEPASVFLHSLGTTTDVVQKEMYRFEHRGGHDLALRPEGTAGVMRYVAGHLQELQDGRLYYLGPMFRSERPQKGRRRQFHQIGAEAISGPNPLVDAEAIALQVHLLNAWGVRGFTIRLNTRGTAEDQVAVGQGLRARLEPVRDQLCEDCRRRFDLNISRILDCKNPGCRGLVKDLPALRDFMSEETRAYHEEVLKHLERLEIPVEVSPFLVRGLDYYQHTIWEITHPGLGSQDALSGGGRYRITMGKQGIDGVGFAIGIERLILAVKEERGDEVDKAGFMVWLVAVDTGLLPDLLELAQTLRLRGIPCQVDLKGRSVKAQMRVAARAGATHIVLRGSAEAERGTFQWKEMATGSQREVSLPELIADATALAKG